ncbi:MAG: uracil phosphoribosyltransferase [Planctomycetota bacterium]
MFEHALIQHKLTLLRDARTNSEDFRALLNEIAGLMVFEVSRNFPTRALTVQTPLESCEGRTLSRPVTLAPILRAGLGMTDGILRLFPEARVGHIGIQRDEQSHAPINYYTRFPKDVADGPVLVVDPMLATGGSAVHAIDHLKRLGCRDLQMVCLVAAPEGVKRLLDRHPEVPVFAAALDRQLDENAYIRPGLGDAGDRIFGTVGA